MTRAEQLAALRTDVDALAQADEATVLAALPQWDSLAILLVVSHFEHVHDLEITGAQVRACRTVADILNLNSSLS
jgi:acyl carrier protein